VLHCQTASLCSVCAVSGMSTLRQHHRACNGVTERWKVSGEQLSQHAIIPTWQGPGSANYCYSGPDKAVCADHRQSAQRSCFNHLRRGEAVWVYASPGQAPVGLSMVLQQHDSVRWFLQQSFPILPMPLPLPLPLPYRYHTGVPHIYLAAGLQCNWDSWVSSC
jgi:hypothetical protein